MNYWRTDTLSPSPPAESILKQTLNTNDAVAAITHETMYSDHKKPSESIHFHHFSFEIGLEIWYIVTTKPYF